MHEWHTETGRNPFRLINSFLGFEFETDYGGPARVSDVKMSDKTFFDLDTARSYVTSTSYGGRVAYMVAYSTGKKFSKAYQNAYANFLERYKEYKDFSKNLTIAYGRKASKVTCPQCESSISLKYGTRFKACPVCGSPKIISDSNWKMLDTKKRLTEKAAENLAKEAEKNDVTFVCGIEWHC